MIILILIHVHPCFTLDIHVVVASVKTNPCDDLMNKFILMSTVRTKHVCVCGVCMCVCVWSVYVCVVCVCVWCVYVCVWCVCVVCVWCVYVCGVCVSVCVCVCVVCVWCVCDVCMCVCVCAYVYMHLCVHAPHVHVKNS